MTTTTTTTMIDNKIILLLVLFLSPLVTLSFVTPNNCVNRSTKTITKAYHYSSQSALFMSVDSKSNTDETRSTTFPVSVRAALVKKAKDLDVSGYSSSGWSNRAGTVLTPAAIPGVYTGDRPFYWNSIDVGCRMVAIQLDNGDLWVHSPINLDQPLKDALSKLGPVKYIVSPNYEHLKFAEQWSKAYPDAYMYGCPGLSERLPSIKWEGEIPYGYRPSDSEDNNTLKDKNCWDLETIVPLHLDVEVNPFTGKPFFNEVIFYHRPSKTMMTTDWFWNYIQSDGVPNSHLQSEENGEWELAPAVSSVPVGSQAWKFAMDKIYTPFYKRFMIKDRSKYDECVDIVLDKWDIENLIPAHGDILRGKDVIRKVLSEFLALK